MPKGQKCPFALQKSFNDELAKMEKVEMISPVTTSEYATPAVPVIKQDGSIKTGGDCKTTVNPCLDANRYPLPKSEDLFAALSGGKHFSKIDFYQAYQQVVMSESSKQYLTLNTQKRLFAVRRLAFGISSASGIFQRITNAILKDLRGVCCYLDDILVTGKDSEEQFINLEAMFKRLLERGVHVKKEKCSFFQQKLRYLGHRITAQDISAMTKKLDALLKAPAPK